MNLSSTKKTPFVKGVQDTVPTYTQGSLGDLVTYKPTGEIYSKVTSGSWISTKGNAVLNGTILAEDNPDLHVFLDMETTSNSDKSLTPASVVMDGGTVTKTDGVMGNGIHLDASAGGANWALRMPNSELPSTGTFTVCFWGRVNNTTENVQVTSGSSNWNASVGCRGDGGYTYAGHVQSPGTDYYANATGQFTPTVGKWHFYAAVFSASKVALTIDDQYELATGTGASNRRNAGSDDLYVHSGVNPIFNSAITGGDFDLVRVFNRELTQEELLTLYLEPSVSILKPSHSGVSAMYLMDQVSGATLLDADTTRANNCTIAGTSVVETGKVGNAVHLGNSSTSVLSGFTNPIAAGSDWALSFWFKHSARLSGVTGTLLQFADGFLQVNTAESAANSMVYGVNVLTLPTNDTADTWHFMVMNTVGGQTTFYFNGGEGSTLAAPTGGLVYIGGTNDGNNTINNYFDQFRAFNRSLTQAEITALYNEGL